MASAKFNNDIKSTELVIAECDVSNVRVLWDLMVEQQFAAIIYAVCSFLWLYISLENAIVDEVRLSYFFSVGAILPIYFGAKFSWWLLRDYRKLSSLRYILTDQRLLALSTETSKQNYEIDLRDIEAAVITYPMLTAGPVVIEQRGNSVVEGDTKVQGKVRIAGLSQPQLFLSNLNNASRVALSSVEEGNYGRVDE